jgi:8-oxo-dGTP pyrophosphatase MutT (NUDIX family)
VSLIAPARPEDIPIIRLRTLDLAFEPKPWRFAEERRAEIDRHFEKLRETKPLWNGRVLVMHRYALEGDVLRGAYLETDFASFVAWRDWGFPDPKARNCFSLGAVRGSDGGFLLGVMGAHTANAGRVYFPGGTPDPSDVTAGHVDLAASVCRELAEETGLDAAALSAEPGWYAALAGPRIALLKVFEAAESADALRSRVLAHLAQETTPELADVLIVRSPSDLTPAVLPFVTAFLRHQWEGQPQP